MSMWHFWEAAAAVTNLCVQTASPLPPTHTDTHPQDTHLIQALWDEGLLEHSVGHCIISLITLWPTASSDDQEATGEEL